MSVSVDIEREVMEFRYWELYSRAYVQYAVVFLLPRVDPSRDREIVRLEEFLELKIPLLFHYSYKAATAASYDAQKRVENSYSDLIKLSIERCRKIIKTVGWEPKEFPFSWNEFFWKSVERESPVYPPAEIPSAFPPPSTVSLG